MPRHAERRVLPYSAEQLFALVADIERYPEFLPWCIAARHRKREANVVWWDLVIGFRMIRERFCSKVTLTASTRIDVEYVEGPLKFLRNHWIFVPRTDGCEIDFYVEFEFRSRVLERLIGALFHQATVRMVNAFEARARDQYGAPAKQPAAAPVFAGEDEAS